MSTKRTIVVTAYGHNKTIDKIAVSLFEDSGNDYHNEASGAETYCNTINSFELRDALWVFSKIVSENMQYDLDAFRSFKFADIILRLDNMAIQKVLKNVDAEELAKAIKYQDEAVKEKVFTNMSKRSAGMFKEDMEYMGPVRMKDARESQGKILSIIRHLTQCGEIIIADDKGETIE
jgi:flagellar motor switch protein FliG